MKLSTFTNKIIGLVKFALSILGIMHCHVSLLYAEIQENETGPQSSFAFGMAMLPEYEGADSYEWIPLTIGRTQWNSGRYLSLEGLTLRANLVPSQTWSFGPLLSMELERSDVKDPQVRLMRPIDTAYEAGIFGEFESGRFSVGFQWRNDFTDSHQGWVAQFEASYALVLRQNLQLFVEGFVNYADSNYVDAYFSVDTDNAFRSGFDVFQADAGVKDVGVELFFNRQLNSRWGLMGILEYSRMVGDVTKSPIVEQVGSADQLFLGFAVNYRF